MAQLPAMPVDPSVGGSERRIVTVLFGDLVGFTTLAEQHDPEDVAIVQDAYFAAVRDTIGRYGGTIEKFIGDAVMAVFGVPRALDDDAVRAVRAGLALVSAIEQLESRFAMDAGALRIRVGVTSGEVVVADAGPDRGRVTGDTVNTAARLQAAAPPGGVLVGEPTMLAVAEAIELAPLTELSVKGKSEPVRAALAVGAFPEPSRDRAMGRLRAPMLGRDAELGELLAAWGRTRGGTSERWIVLAPPGVGKSRLLAELGARVGANVLRARLRHDAPSPYGAVAQILTAAEEVAAEDGASSLDRALEARGASAERRQVILDAVRDLRDPAPVESIGARTAGDDARSAIFDAWLEAIDALVGGPSLWLVEDVHWAGGDLLAFLQHAGAGGGGEPRLVVVSVRPSFREAAMEDAGARLLELSQLGATDAAALVRALVGDALPDSLVQRIGEQSDGTPLFIEELLRTWIGVGTLGEDADGGWRLTRPAEEVLLPATVQGVYAGQLDDLPGSARQLARRASVSGRRFATEAMPLFDVGDASDALETLRRRALVAGPQPDSEIASDASYGYRHALLREAAYASLARAERARLHLRLARWLDAASEGSASVAAQVGSHYAAALESAPTLAAEIGEGLSRPYVQALAGDSHARASAAALAVSAYDSARALARRALDLDPGASPLERSRRWQQLADATWAADDMDAGRAAMTESIALAREALAEARAGHDEVEQAHATERLSLATWRLAQICMEQLDLRPAIEAVNEALGLLDGAGGVALARLRLAAANLDYFETNDAARARPAVEAVLSAARAAGDEVLTASALDLLLVVRAEHDDPPGPADWEELEAAGRRIGDWAMVLGAITNSQFTWFDRDPARCLPVADRVATLAEAHGLGEEVGWANYFRTEATAAIGDWQLAVHAGTRAFELGLEKGFHRVVARTLHVLMPVALARGKLEIVERGTQWHEEQRARLPDSPYARLHRTALDLYAADAGLRDVFVPDPEILRASFDTDPGLPSSMFAADRVLRAWLAAGTLEPVREAIDSLDRHVHDRVLDVVPVGWIGLKRAELARADGSTAGEVGEATRAALPRLRSAGVTPWIRDALALLEQLGAATPQDADEHRLLTERLVGRRARGG